MLAEKVTAEWVWVWLKGRKKKNLKSFQLAITRTFGFIDTEVDEAIFFDLSQVIKDRKLYDLVNKVKLYEFDDSQMFHDWLKIVTRGKLNAIPQNG